MADTTIQADIRDSGGTALDGYILATLDAPIIEGAVSYYSVPKRYELVAGQVSFDLPPTEDDRTSYRFQVWQYNAVTELPDVAVTDFHAQIPASAEPVPFTQLGQQTGLDSGRRDSNLAAIVRSLYLDPAFWALARDILIPHKGAYDPSAYYKNGDVVEWQGSSFIFAAELAQTGVEPVDGETWKLIAAKGEPGNASSGADLDPYSAIAWDGNIEAPSKGSLQGIIETLQPKAALDDFLAKDGGVATQLVSGSTYPLTEDSSKLVYASWVQAIATQVKQAVVPIGAVMGFPYASAPTGWVLYDGRELDKTLYAALYTVLGDVFALGGEAATVFRVPDYRGRVLAMIDQSAGVAPGLATVGDSAGSAEYTLIRDNLPSYKPNVRRSGDTGGSNTGLFRRGDLNGVVFSDADAEALGSDVPFSLMQPTSAIIWCGYSGVS